MSDGAYRMGDPASRAIARWRRRVRLGLLLGGVADGVAVTAILGAAAILVLRLFGVVAAPHPWWAAALLVPAAAAAARLKAGGATELDAALGLERRLGLEGLLLCGLEVDVSAWRSRLDAPLAHAGSALPRLRWKRAVARAALPLAALGGVLLLPPPTAETRPEDPALARALERFEQRFREIAKNEGLREEARRDVEERIRALEKRRERGEAVSWADVDAAEERLDREARQRAAELAKAKAAAAAFLRSEHGDAEAARAEIAPLVTAAEQLGLLDDVPAGVAAKAGVGPEAGTASVDAAALEALAEALGATAGERLEALAQLGVIDPADAAALERMLEEDAVARREKEDAEEACGECHGDRPEGCDG